MKKLDLAFLFLSFILILLLAIELFAQECPTQNAILVYPGMSIQRALEDSRITGVKQIYLRSGKHSLTQTIDVGPQDKGVNISAYPGEAVVIDGGENLLDWRYEYDGLYSTLVQSVPTTLDLIVSGKRQSFGSRWYFGNGMKDGDWTTVYFTDLIQSDFFPFDGMQLYSVGWDIQQDSINTIKSIEWLNNLITLVDKPKMRIDSGAFKVLHNPRLIKEVGQFAWSGNRLYFRPASQGDLSSVVLPRLKTLISVHDTSDVFIRNMIFQNTPHDGPAVSVRNTTAAWVGGNTFRNVGSAVNVQKSNWVRIAGNLIENSGSHGVEIGYSNSARIYANTIKGSGAVRIAGSGIQAYGLNDSHISYNEIYDTSRYGISIKSWDVATESRANWINFNRVIRSCQGSGDCGAIETLGRTHINTGTMIQHNWIEEYGGLGIEGKSFKKGFKAFGIYLDDMSSGFTVSGNLTKHSGYGLSHVYLHGGDNNVVSNNIGLSDHKDMRFLRLEYVPLGGDAGIPRNNNIQRNIISYSVLAGPYWWYGNGGTSTIDYNVIFNSRKYYPQDVNSVVADPLLDSRYMMKPDSPGLKLGISQLLVDRMGARGYSPSTLLKKFW